MNGTPKHMPYYLAEIRFNRAHEKPKRDPSRRKQKIKSLLTIVLTSALVLPALFAVPTAFSSTNSTLAESLEELSAAISVLPADAFKDPNAAEGQRRVLRNKINAVIHQIEAGAFNGALNKLTNDVKKAVTELISPAPAANILELINAVIDLITGMPPPAPDFAITASPSHLTIEPGGFGTTTIIIESLNEFHQSVYLNVTSPPITGITNTFDPVWITPPPDGSASSTLTVTTASNVAPGNYVMTVTGTNDTQTHSTHVTVEVTSAPPLPDFDLAADPTSITVQQGGANTSLITITSLEGFSQPVALAIASEPVPSVTLTLHPPQVVPPPDLVAISTLTITVSSNATVGSHHITVEGTSNSLSHLLEFSLEITTPPIPSYPDFSLAAFPNSVTIPAGGSVTSTIVVTSLREFSEPVDLKVTPEPVQGVTITFDAPIVAPPPNIFVTSMLTITVDLTALPGDATMAVVGTSGTLKHSVDISLRITVDDTPPVVFGVLRLPAEPSYNESVTVLASVTDADSGVNEVIMGYERDNAWNNATMTLKEVSSYEAYIPAFSFGTVVEYLVAASDNAGNKVSSSTYSYAVSDPYPPQVGVPRMQPETPEADMDVIISIIVTEPLDSSGVRNVVLWYNATGEWQPLEMTLEGVNWTATIPGHGGDVGVRFYVEAWDQAGNSKVTLVYAYEIKPVPWPLAGLAGIALGVAALTGAGVYVIYRRRIRRSTGNAVKYRYKPVVSF